MARRCWDVEFFPLRMDGPTGGVLILGRITPVAAAEIVTAAPLAESLIALRERTARRFGPELLSGAAPALRLFAEQVRLAAATTAPVLLIGEPGTGKQTLARRIHYEGPTPGPAFRRSRLRSAAGRGAGGSLVRRRGRARRDLSARAFASAARLPIAFVRTDSCAADERDGSSVPRILAGCSADPWKKWRAGRLLDELYSSLAVLTLSLPPLRERMADLSALVVRLLDRCNAEGGAHIKGIAADAWEVFRAHAWPGNLRELYAVLAAARRHARTDRITVADLPAWLRLVRRMEETPAPTRALPLPLDALLEEAERRLMELAIRRAGGNKKRAADLLSIPRPRIWRRLKALGLIENETSESDESGEE